MDYQAESHVRKPGCSWQKYKCRNVNVFSDHFFDQSLDSVLVKPYLFEVLQGLRYPWCIGGSVRGLEQICTSDCTYLHVAKLTADACSCVTEIHFSQNVNK